MFNPLVITVTDSSFRTLICLAISAVVVPESRMTVSNGRIRRAAAWPMRSFSRGLSVSLIEMRMSPWSRRFSAPPCERTSAPPSGQRVQVAADGDRRDIEAIREVLDGDPFFLVEQLEDAPAAFFDEQLQRFPIRDVDHDYAHPGSTAMKWLAGGLS